MGGDALAGPSLRPGRFGIGHLSSAPAKRLRLLLRRLVMTCSVLFVLGYGFSLLREAGQTGAPLKTSPAAPFPAWIEIPSPRQIFRLDTPEFAGAAKYYEARQHRTGGGRQDVFGFAGPVGVPLVRLIIYRPGEETAPEASFFVDLARRAAETGRAIARATQPTAVATRFGAFEAADVTLAREGSSDRDCVGFRFANPTPDLRISGFACGFLAPKLALACLINRISLATLVEDGDLIAFFGARPSRDASACGAMDLAPALPRSSRK